MLNYDISYYLNKYKKQIQWSVVAFLVVIIVFMIVNFISSYIAQQGKITVPISVVPGDSTVIIDGEEQSNSGDIYLEAGEHKVKVSHPGFRTVERSYRIYDYNAPAIYISLIGESDEAKEWQQNNLSKYRKLEILTTQQAHKYTEKFESRNPIVEDLPVKDPYFTISYKNIQDKTIQLTIWGTSPRYREFALEHLRSMGYDPTDYSIEFTDFDNPLKPAEDREESK